MEFKADVKDGIASLPVGQFAEIVNSLDESSREIDLLTAECDTLRERAEKAERELEGHIEKEIAHSESANYYYYHMWQESEARNAQLEAALEKIDRVTPFAESAQDNKIVSGGILEHIHDIARAALFSAPDGEGEAEFVKHLKSCSDEIKTWPEWKQNVLGSVSKPTPAPDVLTRESKDE